MSQDPTSEVALSGPSSAHSRRAFLRRGLYGAAGIGIASATSGLFGGEAFAAGLRGRVPSTLAESPSLGSLDVQLQWIKNFNWAGMYIALNRGYYKKAGLDVNLIPGGATVVPETVVLAGKAQVGFSSADAVASAVLQGAGFKIFGTQYQLNPFGIMSLASAPITSPKEMVGKKIGLSSENKPELDGFLAANKIDPSSITMVSIGYSPVSAFASKQIDACLAFVENPIELEAANMKAHYFSLAEFNYNIISDSYFATEKTIETEGAKLKALLLGDIQGWNAELADPSVGAELGFNVYGKGNGLVLKEEIASAKLQNTVVADSSTKKNGILSIPPALQEQVIKALAAGGIKISAEKLFDSSLIDSVYAEHPSLKAA